MQTWKEDYKLTIQGFIAEGIILFILSVLDVKKKSIPIFYCPLALVINVSFFFLFSNYGMNAFFLRLVFCCLVFFIMFIGNLFFNLGGADTLTATAATFNLSIYGLIMCISACILSIPYALYVQTNARKKHVSYPFIPFIFMGYVISSLMILTGILPESILTV